MKDVSIRSLKRIVGTAAVAVFFALGASSASADYIYDLHEPNAWLVNGSSYGDTFDLTDEGLPDDLTAISAVVGFSFLSLRGEVEEVEIKLANEVASTHDLDFGIAFLLGGEVAGSIIGTLNTTGMVDYMVNYTGSGIVKLTLAGIAVEVTKNAGGVTGVPDGGSTLFLFGAGVVGAGLLARGRRKTAR